MKRKIIFCITLSLFFSLISCKDERVEVHTLSEDDFKNDVQLYDEKELVKEILNVRNFFIQDSFMVINNSREDSVFMVFDLNTFECIKSWGLRGEGPAEYGTFTHLLNIPQKNIMQMTDFSRNRIETYNIPEFKLKEKQNIELQAPTEKRQIPQNIVTPDGNIYFYDNLFANQLSINKWEIGESQPVTINRFEYFKDVNETPLFYTGSLAINSDEDKLVYAYRYKRRFDIMDLEGNLIKAVRVTPPRKASRKHVDEVHLSTIHYNGVRASNDSFFLLYIGHLPEYIEENDFLVTCYIEQYDWDGNPVKRYELNRYINDFDIVFEKNQPISYIGIDINNEIMEFK